jgi:hypothetical protein
MALKLRPTGLGSSASRLLSGFVSDCGAAALSSATNLSENQYFAVPAIAYCVGT